MANTTYTLSVSGAQDSEGNSAPARSVTFTTGSGPDLNPPVPVANNLAWDGSMCSYCGVVPTNIVLSWLFNKPIASGSVNGSTVYLTDNSANVVPSTTSVSLDGSTVTLQPTTALTPSYSYYHAHVTGVSDNNGNILNPSLSGGVIDLQANCSDFCAFQFSTGTGPDSTPPTVQLVSPPNGLTNLPLNALIQAQLSKPLDPGSFDTSNVSLSIGSTPVPVAVWFATTQQTVELYPLSFLAPNTTYTVTLTDITDVTGNTLASPYSWSFTTGNSASLTAPVPTFTPAPGSTGVSKSTVATITYNKPINPLSVNTTSSVYLDGAGKVVPATYSYSPDYTTLTITPNGPLASNTLYYIYGYYVQDLAGNQDGGVYGYFTTGP